MKTTAANVPAGSIAISQVVAKAQEHIKNKASRSLLPTFTFLKLSRDDECREQEKRQVQSTLQQRHSIYLQSKGIDAVHDDCGNTSGSGNSISLEELLESKMTQSPPDLPESFWKKSPMRSGRSIILPSIMSTLTRGMAAKGVAFGPIFDNPHPPQTLSSIVRHTMPPMANPIVCAANRLRAHDESSIQDGSKILLPIKLSSLDIKLLEYEHLLIYLKKAMGAGKREPPKSWKAMARLALDMPAAHEVPIKHPTIPSQQRQQPKGAVLASIVEGLKERKQALLQALKLGMGIEYGGPFRGTSAFWDAVRQVVDDHAVEELMGDSAKDLYKQYRLYLINQR